MTVIDQIGQVLHFSHTPLRIISLVPSQTALLHYLGLEDCVVGVTKFCVHPVHYRKEKIKVGGTKNVNFEKIKSLNPDVILCNKEENTKVMVDELRKICPVHVSEIYTIDDSLDLIRMYGQMFGVVGEAVSLCDSLTVLRDNFLKNQFPVRRVAYFIWRNPWMVTGSNTIINHLLELNNFENCFIAQSRYPIVNMEELKEANPELVLLSSEPFPFKERHIKEIKEVLPDSRVLLVDGEMFSWYGSHLLASFPYFKNLQKALV